MENAKTLLNFQRVQTISKETSTWALFSTSISTLFYFRNAILNTINQISCNPSNRATLYNSLNFLRGYGSSGGRPYIVYVLTGRRNQNEIVTSQLGATLNNFNQESVIPYFFYGSSQGTYVYNTIAQSFSGRARILQREPLNGFSTELADTVCSLIQGTAVPTTPSPTSKTILIILQ